MTPEEVARRHCDSPYHDTREGLCSYCHILAVSIRAVVADNHKRLREALEEIGKHEKFSEMNQESLDNVDSVTGHDYFICVARAALPTHEPADD